MVIQPLEITMFLFIYIHFQLMFLRFFGTWRYTEFFRLHIGGPTRYIFLVIIKDEYLTFEKGIILKLQEKIAIIEKRGLEKSKRE